MKLHVGVIIAAMALSPLARAEDANHGRALFMADGCYQCHGTVGQGTSVAPKLSSPAWPAQAIAAYIRQPAGQMPPYSSKLVSNPDIGDIHAYLASIQKPEVDVARVLCPGAARCAR